MSDQLERHILHGFDEELRSLHGIVCKMGELVLNQLCQALESLRKTDPALAEKVIKREREVNQLEVTTASQILNILARRCPVAGDLRFVMAASRIINDLERIGDEGGKIANFALFLHTGGHHDPSTYPLDEVYAVGDLALTTLRHTLQAVTEINEEKAKAIAHDHKALDEQFNISLNRLMNGPQPKNHHQVSHSVRVVLILKSLERVGDHAQNLAESVIFQVAGEDVRHSIPDYNQEFSPADQTGQRGSPEDPAKP